MRFGIGIDIENVKRFRNMSTSLLHRLFTDKEIAYSFRVIRPEERLANRFCAKEAIVKSYSSLFGKKILTSDVEIECRKDGAPKAMIRKIHGLDGKMDIQISMSHTKDMACAVAIIIINNKIKKKRSI